MDHTPVTTYVTALSDGGVAAEFDTWLQREFNSIYDLVKLISLECELPLKEIYQDVIFPLGAAPTLNPFEDTGES